jgi:DNA integrity scanning protein DisA with diadenylate cyclase activity
MRRVRDTHYEVRLIVAVVCILLLVTPGVVIAATVDTPAPGTNVTAGPGANGTEVQATPALPVFLSTENTGSIIENITIIPTTPVPPVYIYLENATNAVNPPPLLIFDTPLIENLTCTIYGIAEPGSGNTTILSILWDWGEDQTPEYHGFQNSHTYRSPGIYSLSIIVRQSDGQIRIGTTKVTMGQPVIPVTVTPTITVPGGPGGPVMVIHPPVLTLFEPTVDRMNVTLNGNLNAGSPGAAIASVTVDWDDGTSITSADLPVTHQYSRAGTFTVTVTGNQSDGQSATKKIALEVRGEIPVPPGPTPSDPTRNNLMPYLSIITIGITGIVIVAVVLITQRRREPPMAKDSFKAFPARTNPRSENRPPLEELKTISSGTGVEPQVLDTVIKVAAEIAREGREGQAIGTAFVVGDTKNVLKCSKQFVLNPFYGHHETERQITDTGIQGTIKEFAQLDGAFLITGNGVVEAAGRCITVDLSQVDLPGGMGSRHLSVAGITKVTSAIGIVVSQSGGQISIFRDGKIVYVIRP